MAAGTNRDDRPVLSIDEAARAAGALGEAASDRADLRALAHDDPLVEVTALSAGYGRMEILHDIGLFAGPGQSLCLIGPNGAGKSTVLHSIFGFADVMGGRIAIDDADVMQLTLKDKLKRAGIAYILQDNSVFPDMTVEENLVMGGYLLDHPDEARPSDLVRPHGLAG